MADRSAAERWVLRVFERCMESFRKTKVERESGTGTEVQATAEEAERAQRDAQARLAPRPSASFVEETIRNGLEIVHARIFSVTLPEADAALAPYFVLGRIVSGEVVGVRTFRVWT